MSDKGIRFDPEYVKTIPGIVKIGQLASSLLGLICVQTIYVAAYQSAGGWYSFVSMTGFCVPTLLFLAYLFHIVEKFSGLPWHIVEFGFSTCWTVFFFIAACVAAANAKEDSGWGAAAFFGVLAIPFFAYESYTMYHLWKDGVTPQSEKTGADSGAAAPSYPAY